MSQPASQRLSPELAGGSWSTSERRGAHRGASAPDPARPSRHTAPARGPGGRPRTRRAARLSVRALGRELVDPGGPKEKRPRAEGRPGAGTPRASLATGSYPVPAPAVCWSTRAEERGGKGARGPETRVAALRARTATPGTGAGGPRTPLGALRLRGSHPGSPDTVPARRDEPHRRWTGRGGGNRRSVAPSRDARPPPHNSSPPVVGGRPGGRKTDGRRRTRTPRRATARTRARADKPLCRGLTFNRSQRGSCSATYETPTQKQVVYEWFSARFPTNVRCVTGEGAAAFPAAPRFPGRRALRTGPRSRRAAGHAPRGARRPAGGDRRGTGYPRPTEAPRRCRIVPPGRDSDLEAFSHNPTDGSFAPLAPQPSTYTKCLNLRFLSY